MKNISKLIILTTIALSLATGVYAATDQSTTTTASVTIGEVFSIALATANDPLNPSIGAPRSTNAISFRASPNPANAWYYNNACTAWTPEGDPDDSRADVAIIMKANVNPASTYYLKISKASDSLNGLIGFSVGEKAYYWDGTSSLEADGTTAQPSTGFMNTKSEERWGTLPTSATTIYTSSDAVYAVYGVTVGINYALVPVGLSQGTYSTTITYTMTTSA